MIKQLEASFSAYGSLNLVEIDDDNALYYPFAVTLEVPDADPAIKTFYFSEYKPAEDFYYLLKESVQVIE